ncbi:preprotein translocase membrane subunit [Wigglesworthia glossinidia endosymbiont of Glossina morsitans morsitans (Yale colony)]|uniref:Protein translocase subunit SecE n=1 Tax=Wigglesworthia glossinidia endosymbiont of Glossina morsitans morsitans (Yale colony) TaxID=1142511 RepID=H6Q4M1_WIGGL|nr:preprotein translocase subunit SecE [Wigglesworthia glossinidia]AFA41081.1 preprotein translocase membrane subunit [Wigglesworthia glossinidia endosymbiont of Glossina morsitans morsitans (Yale colony)]
MNTEHQKNQSKYKKDIFIWIFVITLLITAFLFSELFPTENKIIKVFSVSLMIFLACFLFTTTIKGKKIIKFIYISCKEMQKVIWPSFQEALQTTLIVSLVTLIMSLLLWGLDSLLIRIISFITGLRF